MFYYEKNMVDINDFNAIPSPGGLSDKPSHQWRGRKEESFHQGK